MDSESFLEAVRTENQTALSRLGSSKALYADTAGEMEADRVLDAAATAEHHAAETFAGWADDESDGRGVDAFRTTASEERDHYDVVTGELADHDPGDPPAIQAYLRELEGPVERAGGMVGRTISARKSKDQLTGFFVGQADPTTSQLFRDLGNDLDAQLDRATELLADLCGDDPDCWATAETAATGAIQAAYEEYTERLETLGVDPKPVC